MSDEIPGDEFMYPEFIPLTKGHVAVVDRWAYDDIVAMGAWHYHGGYARRKTDGGRRAQLMHREVLLLAGVELDGSKVDHINGDKSDNRLSNLRPATTQQNAANSRSHSKSSRFKGIYNHKRWGWQARYKLDGKERSLGYYSTEEEAARAYDAKMLELWGHWAKLNFPLKLIYETQGPPRIKRQMAA